MMMSNDYRIIPIPNMRYIDKPIRYRVERASDDGFEWVYEETFSEEYAAHNYVRLKKYEAKQLKEFEEKYPIVYL